MSVTCPPGEVVNVTRRTVQHELDQIYLPDIWPTQGEVVYGGEASFYAWPYIASDMLFPHFSSRRGC